MERRRQGTMDTMFDLFFFFSFVSFISSSPSVSFWFRLSCLVLFPSSYCNHTRDLDLCRDPLLQEHRWECVICGIPFDRKILERRLVETLLRAVSSYQVQDLRCVNCGGIKPDTLTRQCQCSGDFHLSQTRTPGEGVGVIGGMQTKSGGTGDGRSSGKDPLAVRPLTGIQRILQTFRGIAVWHEMRWLEETVQRLSF